jgi:hypothetical protein
MIALNQGEKKEWDQRLEQRNTLPPLNHKGRNSRRIQKILACKKYKGSSFFSVGIIRQFQKI